MIPGFGYFLAFSKTDLFSFADNGYLIFISTIFILIILLLHLFVIAFNYEKPFFQARGSTWLYIIKCGWLILCMIFLFIISVVASG